MKLIGPILLSCICGQMLFNGKDFLKSIVTYASMLSYVNH